MYGNFAGRDASRGMAKQSFDLGNLLHQRVGVQLTIIRNANSRRSTSGQIVGLDPIRDVSI